MAESLRERGYRTGAVGKWHLGIGEGGRLLPTGHGFDSFYGMGCTNTLACGVSEDLQYQEGSTHEGFYPSRAREEKRSDGLRRGAQP